MSTWDQRAREYAESRTYEHLSHGENARHEVGVVRGARWQREVLLSDESVERVMLGIHASHDRGDWDEELPVVQDECLDMARAALAAALGEDESNE